MSVTRLIDRAAGIPVVDLSDWLATWTPAEALGEAVTVVLVVERPDGSVECVPQSVRPMDGFRLIGLLEALQVRLTQGEGTGW